MISLSSVDLWNLAACELVYVFVVFAPAHFIRRCFDNDEIVSVFSEGLQNLGLRFYSPTAAMTGEA